MGSQRALRMQKNAESYRVAMALARGTPVQREYLTPGELREVFHVLLQAVGADGAFAELALIDGREALVRFPRLSDEFLSVRGTKSVRAADFAFLPDAGSIVWGADPVAFGTMLEQDLRRHWVVPLVVAILTGLALYAGAPSDYVSSLGQVLVVASSLFFTVFVIFGIGQVVRPATGHLLYETGAVQEGLDADRYCVRLAVAGFAVAFAAIAWSVTGAGVFPQSHSVSYLWLVAGPCVLLVGVATVAVLLCMLATTGYLLKRSADLALKQSAYESFAAAARVRASAPVERRADEAESASTR